jgi:hypothetical protein
MSQSALVAAGTDTQIATNCLVKKKSTALSTSWDLAYISLVERPQVIEPDATYHLTPDYKSPYPEPQGPIPSLEEHMEEVQDMQQALQREQFYRGIIRYWRACHVCLALLTIGLTLWHLEYAATILIPIWFH